MSDIKPIPLPPQQPDPETKKRLRQLDFEVGATTKHLRLPEGLPKEPKER